MELFNLEDLVEFNQHGPVKKELAVTANFKKLLICFEPGQEVQPCRMARHTAFYFVNGTGAVNVEGEEKQVSAGCMVLIPPNLERQIKARTRLVVLALQYT